MHSFEKHLLEWVNNDSLPSDFTAEDVAFILSKMPYEADDANGGVDDVKVIETAKGFLILFLWGNSGEWQVAELSEDARGKTLSHSTQTLTF